MGCRRRRRRHRSGGREPQLPVTAPGRAAALRLHRLDLVPLQLQQPLQVLLQRPHRLGPGCTAALSVEEHGQLPQAPAAEGGRQEVWVAEGGPLRVVIAAVVLLLVAHGPTGPREVWREVAGVDDLGPQVEVRGSAGGAGGGEDGQPLGVGQVAGAVRVILLLVVVAVQRLRCGGRGAHRHVAQTGDGGEGQGEGPFGFCPSYSDSGPRHRSTAPTGAFPASPLSFGWKSAWLLEV